MSLRSYLEYASAKDEVMARAKVAADGDHALLDEMIDVLDNRPFQLDRAPYARSTD